MKKTWNAPEIEELNINMTEDGTLPTLPSDDEWSTTKPHVLLGASDPLSQNN